MKSSYEDSPIMDYLYANASADYTFAGEPPDFKIRSKRISNHIQEDTC